MTIRSFLDRFVHPWIAAIATAGVVVWLISFLIAATGLVVRSGNGVLAFKLFFWSGILGVFGIAVLGGCSLWLVGVRARQVLWN